jgi:Carboxypeptidase regulatory-like domain
MKPKGMKSSLLILAVALCSSMAVAVSSGTITGRVVDPQGAVIQGAHLLFHRDYSGQNKLATHSDFTRETDASGQFDIQLEPGFYDVCVMASAFTSECRKVLVTEGTTIQHNTELKVDALVMQHSGDTF